MQCIDKCQYVLDKAPTRDLLLPGSFKLPAWLSQAARTFPEAVIFFFRKFLETIRH